MDSEQEDVERGDIVIKGHSIQAVSSNLDVAALAADGAIVVDAEGTIVLPGFQDGHRHCWQNQLRQLISDVDDLEDYVDLTHRTVAPLYTPEDVYIANNLTAWGCLDAGITTVLDFFHNRRSAEHAEAAIAGITDAGIRVVHASCAPLSGSWDGKWPADLPRLRDTVADGVYGPATVRMGVVGSTAFGPEHAALSERNLRFAREHGLAMTVDAVLGDAGSANLVDLGERGLLGDDVTLIHCNALSPEAWRHIADSDCHVVLAPTSDAQIGITAAVPPIQDVLDAGLKTGLSVDVEVALSGDMHTQMRLVLNTQRMLRSRELYYGRPAPERAISVRDVLGYATIDGAHANGVGDQVGSLRPGKRADLIVIDATAPNTMPRNNAVGTAVLGADARNVLAVFVDGRARKWAGSVVGWDQAGTLVEVERSRDRLIRDGGLQYDPINGMTGRLRPAAGGYEVAVEADYGD
ncbi:amidohydrolase family protein [Nocardioides immobilis]|nr:amidohydrolase family protein [Nocardioides immobilis]